MRVLPLRIHLRDAHGGARTPSRLATVQFFNRLHEVLAPNGVLIANVTGALGKDTTAGARLCRTMEQSFGALTVFPVPNEGESGEIAMSEHRNNLVLAMANRQPCDLDALRAATSRLAAAFVPSLQRIAEGGRQISSPATVQVFDDSQFGPSAWISMRE